MNRLWIVLGLLYACGDNVHPIERPPAPQVSSAGGPVLVGPEIVPIFFAGDEDMQHQLEGFLDEFDRPIGRPRRVSTALARRR